METLNDYLDTRFDLHTDSSVTSTQPYMAERVIDIIGLEPISSEFILYNDPPGKYMLQSQNYISAICCLSCIQTIICPDLTMVTQ